MKELIYIHAATSHIASHIFNARQSYLPEDDRDDGESVDHGVSFLDYRAPDGSLTYCPRALLFDTKENFGSLTNISVLSANSEQEESSLTKAWLGKIDEQRQELIPPSTYHQQLDAGVDDMEENNVEDLTQSVRFWSDYSRMFFHPRGLHRVPDLPEWQTSIGWRQGTERFMLYDAEHSVMEDSFRLFAEECDLLQGVQVAVDAPTFGSFILSLLSQLRDEYPKLPLLSFCMLAPADPAVVDLDDTLSCVGVMNDALTVHELASLSNITVPLQHPITWQRGQWSKHLNADFTLAYHSSAILAAHIESATLPLHLERTAPASTDLATMCAHLNWRGDTPIATLSGAFPSPHSLPTLDAYTFNFSHPRSTENRYMGSNELPFAQRDVFRGLYPHEMKILQKLINDPDVTQPRLQAPLLSTSYIVKPYPINSSHPQFFTGLDAAGREAPAPVPTRARSLPTYTSLRTAPSTGALAESYARLLDDAQRRGRQAMKELGVEREEVEEAREGWWTWAGSFGVESE